LNIAKELIFVALEYLINGCISAVLEAVFVDFREHNFVGYVLIFIGRVPIQEFSQKTLFLVFQLHS
jgi:hypothetical protein